jgi:hypothetical protein
MTILNPCPKCGAQLEQGYGLAGGGIGPYEYCSSEQCDYFLKFPDPEMDEPPIDTPPRAD